MKKEPEKIITADLRDILKIAIKNEIKELPAHLATLDIKERLNILCKLMPLVFPKVESVDCGHGEPW